MLHRNDFIDRRCVEDVVHIVQQLPLRAEVRSPLVVDRHATAILLLWSLLRWERNFLIRTLESLGVDLWALTRDVDELLRSRRAEAQAAGVTQADTRSLDVLVRFWLDRASMEARSLTHPYLAPEHILLALLHGADSPVKNLLRARGVESEAFVTAVETALQSVPQPFVPVARLWEASRRDGVASWIVSLDRPAIGVQRRFGVFVMLMIVTLYAVLFSLLRTLRVPALGFGLVGGFVAIIGLAQAVLFGGRFPRAASVWVGMFLFPMEAILGTALSGGYSHYTSVDQFLGITITWVFVGAPLGAVSGYLVGTLTAAGFFILDKLEKRRLAAEEETSDK